MASGIISGSTANAVITAKIEWESTSNAADCSSTVTAKLYLRRTNLYSGTATGGANNFKLQIGDAEFPGSGQLTVPNDGTWVLACQGTAVIVHEPDGSKTVPIKASGGLPPSSVKWVSCAADAVLDTIQRGSQIDSFSSANGCLDGELKAVFSPVADHHKLRLLDGNTKLREVTLDSLRATPEHTFCLTPEERERLYTAHTDTDKITLTLELDAYKNAECTEQQGATARAELELAMPEEVRPELTVQITPWGVDEKADGFTRSLGLYVQNKTGMEVSVTLSAKYGATATDTVLTVNGGAVELTDGVYKSELFTDAQWITVIATATDSRNITKSLEQKIYVHPYTDPKLTASECCRCMESEQPENAHPWLYVDAAGTVYEKADDGQCLYAHGAAEYTQLLVDGTDVNSCRLYVCIKPTNASAYGGLRQIPEGGAVAYGDAEGLAVDISYRVQLIARDLLGRDAVTTFLIPTANVQCHEGNGFLALGQYSEGPGLDIGADWPVRIRSRILLWDAEKENYMSLEEYIKSIINGG